MPEKGQLKKKRQEVDTLSEGVKAREVKKKKRQEVDTLSEEVKAREVKNLKLNQPTQNVNEHKNNICIQKS